MIPFIVCVVCACSGIWCGYNWGWVNGFDDGVTESDEIEAINNRREFDRLWTHAMDLFEVPIDDVKKKELKLLFDAEATKQHERNI